MGVKTVNIVAKPMANDAISIIRNALDKKITQGNIDLPLLPEVARETLSMTRDDSSDASMLAKLIHRDQALAAHLLKIANSPAYLGTREINSLQQTIARLGFRVISEITLAMVIRAQLFNVKGYEETLDTCWRHALASGAWAKEIARKIRYNVETAFLCGLLHEIGKPVVLQALIDVCQEEDITADHKMIVDLMDEFSVLVGTMLAEAWDLPAPVVEAIAFYQTPDLATSFAKEANIVACANEFTLTMLQDRVIDSEYLKQVSALATLNLYQEDIDSLIASEKAVKETIEALSS